MNINDSVKNHKAKAITKKKEIRIRKAKGKNLKNNVKYSGELSISFYDAINFLLGGKS